MQGEIICARAGGIIQRNFHKYINTVKWIHVMCRHFISELLMCLPINLSGMFTLICSIYLRRMFNSKTAKTAKLVHRRASQVSDAEFALKGPCTDVCSGRQMHKEQGPEAAWSSGEDLWLHTHTWLREMPPPLLHRERIPSPTPLFGRITLLPGYCLPSGATPPHQLGQSAQKALGKNCHIIQNFS